MTVTSSVRWLPMGRSPIGSGVTTVWHCQGIGTLEPSPKRGCLDCSFLSRTRLFFSWSEGGQDKSRYDYSWVSVLKGAPVMVWDTIRSALLDTHFGDGHSRALKIRLKWLPGTHWLWAGLQASPSRLSMTVMTCRLPGQGRTTTTALWTKAWKLSKLIKESGSIASLHQTWECPTPVWKYVG